MNLDEYCIESLLRFYDRCSIERGEYTDRASRLVIQVASLCAVIAAITLALAIKEDTLWGIWVFPGVVTIILGFFVLRFAKDCAQRRHLLDARAVVLRERIHELLPYAGLEQVWEEADRCHRAEFPGFEERQIDAELRRRDRFVWQRASQFVVAVGIFELVAMPALHYVLFVHGT